jgi:hypothetical protein
MLNFCGIVVAILKMETGRNFSMTVVGWCIAILRFFFTIIIIIIILPYIFVRSVSRRCLDQTLWNWWKESKIILNPPFFVSMATAAKFVQPIPIFWAYLVPLDVDIVPITWHKNRSSLKVVLFVFKIFKMAANIKSK